MHHSCSSTPVIPDGVLVKNSGHQQEVQEEVATVTSTVEPMVGDKRPREDEAVDQNPNQPPASASRPNPVQPQPQSQAQMQNPSVMPMVNPNNFGGQMAIGAMGGQMVNGGMGGMGMGYDALYIGDLQWVRLSCRLASCAYRSEMISRNVPSDAFLFCSGRLMKIYAKSHLILVS